MVEGDGALVCEEDFPARKERGVVRAAVALGEEGLREGFRERAARDGNAEGVVAVETGVLGGQDVFAKERRKSVNVGEGVEVCRLAHVERCFGDGGGESRRSER